MEYYHYPQLAPIKWLLDEYKKKDLSWEDYEARFIKILDDRRLQRDNKVRPLNILNGCLLCAEHEATQCHRRLVAEYLVDMWKLNQDVYIKHL